MKKEERRSAPRYDTSVDIYFKLAYDLKTKVDFQVIDEKEVSVSEKHSAISKNVSSCGMCFTSEFKLNIGDVLFLEVYLPDTSKPVSMEGEVRWSNDSQDSSGKFDTGLKLIKVEGTDIEKTVYFDETYQVEWSLVLESVLGNFKDIAKKWKKSN